MEEQIYHNLEQSVEEDSHEPKVWQEFHSLEDAYDFYNTYAKGVGFSARMSSSKKRKGTEEVIWKAFVCSKQGETENRYHDRMYKNDRCCSIGSGSGSVSEPQRNRGGIRVGCKAKMTLVKSNNREVWSVSSFTKEHNHDLTTPKKIPFLRSHRKVSEAKKNLSSLLALANVLPRQRFAIMEIDGGGIQIIGCTARDLLNHGRDVREDLKGHDAETLYEFFSAEKEKNPAFCFDIEKDNDNRMKRCFWADATARRSYAYFGDVVVFDTTYNTNKYCMMFTPFVGVNHHGQSIIFGSAFLSDETIESFIWLFNKWLNAMPSGPPKVIITDQDPAIAKAIQIALPQTFHRLCIWHITNKFSDKIGVGTHILHWKRFQHSIWGSDTPHEFEESWRNAVEESGLVDHEWLSSLFAIRHSWVPAYVRHIFSAGMSSSQRAESAHAFFKRCLSKNHTLMEFITRYNRSIGQQRHKELLADHIDINESPRLQTCFPCERQMSAIYTKSNFVAFQAELITSESLVMRMEEEDQMKQSFYVTNAINNHSKGRYIVYDMSIDQASCSCQNFEFGGIPCRHLILFLRSSRLVHIPDRYILQRWTKEAKVGLVWDDFGIEVRDVMDRDLLNRHSKLSQMSIRLIDEASLSVDGTEYVCNAFNHLNITVRDQNKSKGISGYTFGQQQVLSKDNSLLDPLKAKAKGSGRRMKNGKEKCIPKARKCNACGQRGVPHDKRNCPNMPNRSTVNDSNNESSDSDDSSFTPLGDGSSTIVEFGEHF